jgi:tetratricopeptide (TPR) repeat protein
MKQTLNTMRILVSISLMFLIGCNSKLQNDKEKLDSIYELALKADSVGDYKTSILYYNQILDIDSLNMGALVNRGRAFISTSQIQEGFVDMNKAIIHYPNERTYFARGVAYMFQNQLDSAKKGF